MWDLPIENIPSGIDGKNAQKMGMGAIKSYEYQSLFEGNGIVEAIKSYEYQSRFEGKGLLSSLRYSA